MATLEDHRRLRRSLDRLRRTLEARGRDRSPSRRPLRLRSRPRSRTRGRSPEVGRRGELPTPPPPPPRPRAEKDVKGTIFRYFDRFEYGFLQRDDRRERSSNVHFKRGTLCAEGLVAIDCYGGRGLAGREVRFDVEVAPDGRLAATSVTLLSDGRDVPPKRAAW